MGLTLLCYSLRDFDIPIVGVWGGALGGGETKFSLPRVNSEYGLRVCENWVLEVFGSKNEEVTEDWRKLHN